MESAQRELVGVLLGRIHSLGLISDFTYSSAMDLIHSAIALPELFRYPACLATEESEPNAAQDA